MIPTPTIPGDRVSFAPTVITRRELLRRHTCAAVAVADYWLRVHRRAMACRFEITLGGEDAHHIAAARAALDRIDVIESELTVFRDSSALVEINRTAAEHPVRVNRRLFDLLKLCQRLHVETERAFDITSTPLSRCWGFMRREGRLPTADEIAAALECAGMRHVTADDSGRTIWFDRSGVELNLGAIGKGWALDRIAATLRADGVTHALLSAGQSSVRTVESLPRRSSTPVANRAKPGWHIALTSPRAAHPLGHVKLRYGALGTSGAGEQFFEVDGKRYGHVIDPRNGWPAAGVLSVSVIASEAAVADALSTAFFVGGVDLARRYCQAHPFVMVVLTPDDDWRRPVLIGDYPGAEVEIA